MSATLTISQQSRRIFLYLVLFFLIWTLRATVLFNIDSSIKSAFLLYLYTNSVKIMLWTVPVILYLIFIDRVNPLTYLRLTTPFAASGWLAVGLGTAAIIILVLLGAWIKGSHITALLSASSWLTNLAAQWLSPFSEEILFRGFIAHKLQGIMGFGRANLLTAFLFTLIHWPNWLWLQGWSLQILQLSLAIFVLGWIFGYVMHKSNSLWPAIGLHSLNNVLTGIL